MSVSRSVVDVYASALQHCAKTKSISEARKLHSTLVQHLGPDPGTYLGNHIVRTYGCCGSLFEACQTFHKLENRNLLSWNILLTAYAQSGHILGAKKTFDLMPERSSVSWSSMISTYAQNGHLSDSFLLFKLLDLEGGVVDSVNFISLVTACTSPEDLPKGRTIHEEIVNSGFETDVAVGTSLVNMYGKCGHLEEAKVAFDRILHPNVVSLTVLISAYAQNGHIHLAKQLFETSAERSLISWTSMISTFSRAGMLHCAVNVFQRIPQRTIISWNAMIAAYARTGEPETSLELLREMDVEGVECNSVTFISALDACGSAGALFMGREIHREVSANPEVRTECSLGNALVGMYGKCGSLAEAREVFESLPHRSERACNTLISAYAQRGHVESALEIFNLMSEKDLVTWNALLSAYTHAGRMREAKEYFDEMEETNVITWNTMISGYLENEQADEAFETFQNMDLEGIGACMVTLIAALYAVAGTGNWRLGEIIRGELILRRLDTDPCVGAALVHMYGKCGRVCESEKVFTDMHRRDQLAWNAMVRSFAHNGHLREAKRMFERMPCTDLFGWNAMLAAHSQTGRMEDLEAVFNTMPSKNVVSWNAMLAGYAQNGHNTLALRLFQQMDFHGVSPNKITFISLLDACGALVAPSEAQLIHSEVCLFDLEQDLAVATGLISMYGKLGRLQEADTVFRKLSCPTTISWNSLLAAYAENGHSTTALEIFHTMHLEAARPSPVSFLIVLTLCSHGGLFHDGLQYSVSMSRDFGLEPSFDHYLCVIDLLGRAGQLAEAEELSRIMPFEPGPVAWTSLLSGCVNHKDVNRAKRVASQVFEQDEPGLYSLLSNTFAASEYQFPSNKYEDTSDYELT